MTSLKAVPSVRGPDADVVAKLEELLEQARSGEIVAFACAYELLAGYSGHTAVFGPYSSRTLIVGKLHVLATHITMNECLEWSPG